MMIIGCLKKIFGGNFRPQQGVAIMNVPSMHAQRKNTLISFRPQQGLTIMNLQTTYSVQQICELFPSPTGVNYYE